MTELKRANGPDTMSAGDLRSKLQAHLRNNGSLGQLKSQLRTMILKEVLVNTTATTPQSSQSAKPLRNQHALADSFVYEHLAATERRYSLSVFSSEAASGIPVGAADADHLRSLFRLPESTSRPAASVLEQLLANVNRMQSATLSSQEVSCQTMPQEAPSLEQRLALVDSSFAAKHQTRRDFTRAEFEMKLSEYRREIEAEVRMEMKRELDVFRAKELAEVRIAEEQKYKTLMNLKQIEFHEMERTVERKGELQQQRLESLKQELELQRVALEKRQKDVLSIVCERDEQILFLEQAANEVRARLRQAQALVAQHEETAASHLMDLERARVREQRRMEDFRRIQGDHMVELRLRDEEIADLQRQLKHQMSTELAQRALADPQKKPPPPPTTTTQLPPGWSVHNNNNSNGLPQQQLSQSTSLPAQAETILPKRTSIAEEGSGPLLPTPQIARVLSSATLNRDHKNEDHHYNVQTAAAAAAVVSGGSNMSVVLQSSVLSNRSNTIEEEESSPPRQMTTTNHQNMSLSTIPNNATTLKHDDSTPTRTSSSSIASSTFSNSSSRLSAANVDPAAQQETIFVNEFDARSDVELLETDARLACQSAYEAASRFAAIAAPLFSDESFNRKEIVSAETSESASIKWAEKNNRDSVTAQQQAKLQSRYGVQATADSRFDAPVTIRRDSDDEDDQLLFGRGDSEDSDF